MWHVDHCIDEGTGAGPLYVSTIQAYAKDKLSLYAQSMTDINKGVYFFIVCNESSSNANTGRHLSTIYQYNVTS